MIADAPPRRLGPIPLGLLGMVGLIVAGEWIVARHDPAFASTWSADWAFAARAARTVAPRASILALGDSQLKFGLAPSRLGAALGRRAYNLAVHGGQPASSYHLLRRALAAGARPSALVVDFEPRRLEADPRYQVRAWSELLGLGKALELGLVTRDGEFLGAVSLASLVPSIRARFEIRETVRSALRGQQGQGSRDVPTHWRNWNRNDGAQMAEAGPFFRADPRALRSNHPWKCHPVNAVYLGRFLDLAARRGLPVVWVLPPVHAEFRAECERSGYDRPYRSFARSMVDRYPNLTVLDGLRSDYGEAAFVDAFHLNARGASALSEDVAGALAGVLSGRSGPRWIELPAYRDRGDDPRLETLGQSRLALAEGKGGRR
jgi:hypothetical protein